MQFLGDDSFCILNDILTMMISAYGSVATIFLIFFNFVSDFFVLLKESKCLLFFPGNIQLSLHMNSSYIHYSESLLVLFTWLVCFQSRTVSCATILINLNSKTIKLTYLLKHRIRYVIGSDQNHELDIFQKDVQSSSQLSNYLVRR
uniref:7TM_GPCR_Srx domain-containing protein n=1 Tax=Heterorhabditis bacteriophora TaxID=37862 RepID=A0A1I7WF55_HETBA